MQYLGGKSRIAKALCAHLLAERGDRMVVEPFCGGLSMTAGLAAAGPRWASDASRPLITLYQAVRAGWDPPSELSEETYLGLQERQDPLDPLTAFAGYGCSFAGRFFAGYARGTEGRNYAGYARNALLRDVPACHDVVFRWASYDTLVLGPEHLCYCDPPYAGTTGYGAVGAFDSAAFWGWARRQADRGVMVRVSEYSAPEGWRVVWSRETFTEMRGKGGRLPRTECLFAPVGGP